MFCVCNTTHKRSSFLYIYRTIKKRSIKGSHHVFVAFFERFHADFFFYLVTMRLTRITHTHTHAGFFFYIHRCVSANVVVQNNAFRHNNNNNGACAMQWSVGLADVHAVRANIKKYMRNISCLFFFGLYTIFFFLQWLPW